MLRSQDMWCLEDLGFSFFFFGVSGFGGLGLVLRARSLYSGLRMRGVDDGWLAGLPLFRQQSRLGNILRL